MGILCLNKIWGFKIILLYLHQKIKQNNYEKDRLD